MTSPAARYAYLNAHLSLSLSHLDLERPPDDFADDRTMEQTFLTRLLKETSTMIRPLSGVARSLILQWARRFDLVNLKTLFYGKMASHSSDKIRDTLLKIGDPFALCSEERLLQTEDLAELLRYLEKTPYATLAREVRGIPEKALGAFAVDAAVERWHISGLNQRMRMLPASEYHRLRPLIGRWIDQFNLSWLLRYRFTYGLAPANAYYLLLPFGYRLHTETLLELAQLEHLESVLKALPEPLASHMTDADATSVVDVESTLDAELSHSAEIVMRRTHFNLARVFAFLILRERQFKKMYGIAKGKHLDFI